MKRERDICVKNVIHSQNTAFMFTPALTSFQTILPCFQHELTRHEPAIQSKTSTWSVKNKNKTRDSHELQTWARDMASWYWSADTLFWQVSTDHNVDVQYQRSLCQPLVWSMTAMLRDSVDVDCRRRRCRRVNAPTSNTASHDNYETIWYITIWLYMTI